MTDTLIERLQRLRGHLLSLDSGSGDAKLLHEAIIALNRQQINTSVNDGMLMEIIMNAQAKTSGKVIYAHEEAKNILDSLHPYLAQTKAAVNTSVCATCQGHGLIGGFINADSGYDAEPCPVCNLVQTNTDNVIFPILTKTRDSEQNTVTTGSPETVTANREPEITGEGHGRMVAGGFNSTLNDCTKAFEIWQEEPHKLGTYYSNLEAFTAGFNARPSEISVTAQLQREIERFEKLVYVPGLWKCAKCKCTTVCSNIHVDTGGFSANNSPQQCPNECGPMWRVTERDAGNELIDRWEDEKAIKMVKADYKQWDGGQYTLRHDEGNFMVEDSTGGLFCVLKYVGVDRAEFILNAINSRPPATMCPPLTTQAQSNRRWNK